MTDFPAFETHHRQVPRRREASAKGREEAQNKF
jgi:hypothetical protein